MLAEEHDKALYLTHFTNNRCDINLFLSMCAINRKTMTDQTARLAAMNDFAKTHNKPEGQHFNLGHD